MMLCIKTLSVFIDESGDFDPYEYHSPYYLVTLILHDQTNDISENISLFDSHLQNVGYHAHAIHTGPLIRRESIYSNDLIEERKYLFNALFNFTRKLNFKYSYIKIRKQECPDVISMTSRLSKALAKSIHDNEIFWNRSELEFFNTVRDFKKNYLKPIKKKELIYPYFL